VSSLLPHPRLLRPLTSPDLPAPSADLCPLYQADSSLPHSLGHSATSPDIPNSVFSLHWFHPIFVLLSRSFHPSDFVSSFLDHDRPSPSSPMHSSMFVAIARPHSAFRSPLFMSRLVFNESLSLMAQLIFWLFHFSPGVDPDQRTSVGINLVTVLFLARS
jgi:hypothetical protein